MEQERNNKICAGIIIWKREENLIKFFVCSPGGPMWERRECWNFPKGQMEENESPFETAVREFKEETGVYPGSLNKNDYTYHGLIKQREHKSVHVYSKEWSGEELGDNCFSNTFIWTDGKEYPEIGKYRWMTAIDIEIHHGVKAYYPIFKKITEDNL